MDASTQSQWEIGARSETGKREENEDRMSSIRIGNDRLYLVADGMGGHNAGALAAKLTVQGLEAGMIRFLPELQVKEAITKVFNDTNQHVYDQAHSNNKATHHMGSTAVMLLTRDFWAYIAHVGDSRAYLFSKGRLTRLTKDHSLVERMVNANILTPDQARVHPQANEIDRAIGHQPQVEVDIADPFELAEGDGILLCSDGLNGYMSDSAIEQILKCCPKTQEAVDHLIQQALLAGSDDNITVQFIRRRNQKKNNLIGYIKNALPWKIIVLFCLVSVGIYGLLALFNTLPTQSTEKPVAVENIDSPATQPFDANQANQLTEVKNELSNLKAEFENLKLDVRQLRQQLAAHQAKKSQSQTNFKKRPKKSPQMKHFDKTQSQPENLQPENNNHH